MQPEGARRLPVVVYLDDIAVYGDDKAQLMTNTAEAIKRLATFDFMMNLKNVTAGTVSSEGTRAWLGIGRVLVPHHPQA